MTEKPVRQQRRYLAYLLRLWQETGGDLPPGEPPLWRASLQSPRSKERRGFAGLDDLVAFLEKETGLNPQDGESLAEDSRQSPAIQD